MTKKHINVGSIVDDYTGDYLRKGGIKINDNFDDIYSELGDTNILHPAGAWKTFVASTDPNENDLYIEFGAEYCIDTTNGEVHVYLPKITDNPLGRAIKLCDPFGSWYLNNVTIHAANGDTINKDAMTVHLDREFQLVSMMSTHYNDWKYIQGEYLDHIDTSQKTIRKLSFILDNNHSGGFFVGDFTEPAALNVYLNGVLLYYSDGAGLGPTGNSDYGSAYIDDNSPNDGLLPLLHSSSRENIQLRNGIFKAGDSVIIDVFSSDYTPTRTSYNRCSVLITNSDLNDTPGQSINLYKYLDTNTNSFIDVPLTEFGLSDIYSITPGNFQLYYNGVLLNSSGMANNPPGIQYQLNYTNGNYESVDISLPYVYAPPAGDPTIRTVTSSGAIEGNDIVHYVAFTKPTTEIIDDLAISITDVTTTSGDYGADLSLLVYSDGVTYDSGSLVIPENTTSFSISIPTVDDGVPAAGSIFKEYTLTIGGTLASGKIYDADVASEDLLPDLPFGELIPDAANWYVDTLTAISFSNIIGTLLDWEGVGGVQSLGNNIWVQKNIIDVQNSISYSQQVAPSDVDYNNDVDDEIDVTSQNVHMNPDSVQVHTNTALDIMKLLYPIGTVYSNASNPSNPATYLGFGVWKKYAAGMFSVGHTDNDYRFSVAGVHVRASDGEIIIDKNNIPELLVTPDVVTMMLNDSGEIPISACVPDPSNPTVHPASLSQQTAHTGDSTPAPINVLPPYMVEYKWVRIQ